MTGIFSPDDLIHSYTRQQAIEDGVLVDVSETAREAGIRYPVALTRAVWARYVEVPLGVECQDEEGRLWDILWMFRYGAEGAGPSLYITDPDGNTVELKGPATPGDDD